MLDVDYHELFKPANPWVKNHKASPFDAELDSDVANARYVAYSIVAPIIVSVGMLGNLLTIFILRLPQFRGVTYTYFLMLAMSDFVSLFFCISFLLHVLHEGTPLYSTAVWYSYCEQLCVNIPMSTSVLIIICVTVDRYFSICRPTDFKRIHTSSYARAGILGSMIIAAAVWLPTCALKKPTLYHDCETSSFVAPDNRTWWVACMVTDIRNNPYYIAYAWIRQTIVSFIPIVILILLNILIVREFIRLRKKKDDRFVAGRLHHHAERRRRDDQHLVTLLTAVMISFFITMVPAGIFNALYTEVFATRLQFEIFRAVANNLEIVNHALNFYIYILCSKPIREAIKSSFRHPQGMLVTSPVSNVVEVVQQASTRDFSSTHSPDASTPKANTILRQQGRDDGGGGGIQREKSKTISKETEPSDVPASDSSFGNSDAEVSSYANDKPEVSSFANDKTEVSSSANYKTEVSSYSNDKTEVSSSANNKTEVSSYSNDKTEVSSSANDKTEVSSYADDTTEVSSYSNDKTEVSSSANDKTEVSSYADDKTEVSSYSNDKTEVSSYSNDKTEVSSYSNDKTLHRKPFDMPTDTPQPQGNTADTVNDEVNGTQCGRGRMFPEAHQTPRTAGSEPSSSHAVEALGPQSVGVTTTPTHTPLLEEGMKVYYNEAFTLEE